ncbi:MAG: AsmA-like C-terminal domain-containing protein [Hyphomonas sp.]|uniref:YhdP family protein n=1 Tax=Hyphomonas sp. TaxID=87 RepID=UPI003527E451
MVRQTASLIFLEILGGLILLVLVAAALLAFRLSSGPMDLSIFRDDLENAMTEARDGRPVRLGGVQLEWSAEDRRLHISGSRLELLDAGGNVSALADHANIVLSGSSLVLGQIEVLRLDLSDGWVNVDQISPTKWVVGGEPLPEIPEGVMPQTPQEWLQRANEVLPPVLQALEDAEDQFSIEHLGFENFEFRVRNAVAEPIMDVADASGSLSRAEDGLILSLAGSGAGVGLPGGIAATLKSSRPESRLHAEFAVANWPLADLASRFGAKADAFAGLPADADVAIDLQKQSGIEQIVVHATSGEGRAPFAGGIDVTNLDVTATYLAKDDDLRIDVTSDKAGPASGEATIILRDILDAPPEQSFELTSNNLTLDLVPTFETPLELTGVTAAGKVSIRDKQLQDIDLHFEHGGAGFHITGSIGATPDRQEGEPPVLASLDLKTTGDVPKETVFSLWPATLGAPAREFAKENVDVTTIRNIVAHLDLERDSFPEGFMRDDDLELTFDVEGASVKFMPDLPPVEQGSGSGRLTGQSFRATLDSAEYGGWQLDEGSFEIPEFKKRRDPFRVFARGHGPATNIMKVLAESRLKVTFDPARLSGMADMTFELFRPPVPDATPEETTFTAIGTLKDGGLKEAALGFDLTNGSANINVTQDGITVSGFGDLGPSPVQFTWRDDFNDGDKPSLLSATSVVTPDFLNEFGMTGRAYLSGEIPIEVQAEIGAENLTVANAALDLTDSRLDLSEIGWIKGKGKPAKASVRYSGRDVGYDASVEFRADDAYLDGDFTIGQDSKLVAATLRRAYLKNKADVGGTITRDRGVIRVALEGSYLDVSGMLPGVGAIGGADAGGSKTPLAISASVDALTLRPGLDMRQAKLSMLSGDKGVQSLEASGLADDGSELEAAFDATGAEGATLRVASGNAGFIASAFLGLDFIEGGRLELDGLLPAGNKPSKFNIVVTNARMRNAPFLTQILSLASLRGLADTLSGEGVLLSRIDVPLTVAGDRYVVTGGKAQGPALGLTANGFVEPKEGNIQFDGVLVPSFGMNSALGTIPIIGDLVVGRDGEGVFSLTYGIRGTMEKANVSVNPLSALAPGVIRRIFENPSDTKIPEARPRPPEEPIPSELPPIPEEEF